MIEDSDKSFYPDSGLDRAVELLHAPPVEHCKLPVDLPVSLHYSRRRKQSSKEVADFTIEAGLFDSLGFGADCFLFTTKPACLRSSCDTTGTPARSTPGLLTMGITRNLALSPNLLRQSDPGGEPFMNNTGYASNEF